MSTDRILSHFPTYCRELLKIKTNMLGPDGLSHERIIPFIFNQAQRKLNQIWEWMLSNYGYIRLIILKARREGISTYTEARLFHKIHTTPNTNAFIIAHDKESTNTIFEMTKLFYDSLPKIYKPMKRYSSKKELVFENPDERSRIYNPGLRSRVDVFTANKITSSRSGGYSCGHFSEVAHYVDAQTLISSTVPTIPDSEGSIIVYESTAFGRGGFFYEEWQKAVESVKSKRKSSNFFPVFLSWLIFEGYSKQFTDGCSREELLSTLDYEEEELLKKHNATPEQLHWRRHKIFDLGDIDLFHQEYPTTPQEAFISSGQCYFNREKLHKLALMTEKPLKVGEITNFGFIENDEGSLFIWEEPKKGEQYVIGIDVGGGIEGGDPSAMEVIRVPRGTPIIHQVAEWVGYVDPVVLASRAIALARYYNEALIAPEINNHGLTTLNEIKANYWNIYRWQYFDRFGKFVSNKIGWECVTPESLILTSDLKWIRAKDIKEKDTIIGFDEFNPHSLPTGSLHNSTVKGIKQFTADLISITLKNGTKTVVSNNHPFLCLDAQQKAYWSEAEAIRPGTLIRYLSSDRIKCEEVKEVSFVGKGQVIGIETSTHTLIVNGLFSHNTNVATRPLLCDYCSACINAEILRIPSKELIDEMHTFIKRPTTGGEADVGCHDDRVMAFMIALFCMAHDYQSSSIIQELGLSPLPTVTEEKPKNIYIPYAQDIEAKNFMLNFEDSTKEYSNWLSY